MELIIEIIKNIIQPMIGVIIGAVVSIYTTKSQNDNQFRLQKDKEKTAANAIKNAIIAELISLKFILKTEFEPKLNEDSATFNYILPIRQDYFAIYNSHLSEIGKISNSKLQTLIVSLYSSAKYFIDNLLTNNELIEINNRTQCQFTYSELVRFKQEVLVPLYEKIMKLFEELESITNEK